MFSNKQVDGVLIYIENPAVGGTERVGQNLHLGLEELGKHSRVATPLRLLGQAERERVVQWHRDAGVQIQDAPSLREFGTLRGWRAFYQWLGDQPERWVNFHFSSLEGASAAAVLCCRLARRRIAVQVQHPVPHSRQRARIASRAVLGLLSDVIVVSTPYLSDHVANGLQGRYKSKVAVIPLGIPTPNAKDRTEARKQTGLKDSSFVVATFTRLVTEKRVEAAIAATARLAANRDVVHVILGDGPERAALEAVAGPHVRFEGYVSDVAQWLAAADVHLLTSEMEGFGLAYVEAALQATPSIGLRVGGVPFVIEDGVTGYLAESSDPEAVCAKLASCEGDRPALREMGLRAQEKVRREFTLAAMARSYVEAMEHAGSGPWRQVRELVPGVAGN